MSLRIAEGVLHLEGACTVEAVEEVLQAIGEGAIEAVDLHGCNHLHRRAAGSPACAPGDPPHAGPFAAAGLAGTCVRYTWFGAEPRSDDMKPILVIEDSPTMLMSISRILQKAGFVVEGCANGQLAIEKIKGGYKPALVLTDLNMPVLDGFGSIRQARQLPATRFTPIVVLTTESTMQKKDAAHTAGASGWLTKHAEPQELLATLKQLLPPG